MNRRNFLAGGTAATMAMTAVPARAGHHDEKRYQGGKSPWPVCLDTATIRPAGDLAEKVRIAAEAGYDAIEPWDGDLASYEQAGGDLKEVTVIGGGARSAYWGRIVAAALETPLVYRRDAEVGPAYGAAKLAQLSIAVDADIAAVCAPPPVRETIEPKPDDVEALAGKRERFSAIYNNVNSLFFKGD